MGLSTRNLKMHARPIRLSLVIYVAVFLIIAGFHLHFTWHRYQTMLEVEAIKLAESLGAVLPAGHISAIPKEDSDRSNYNLVKNKLMQLVEATSLIHYAYLLGEQDDKIFVMADSNLDDTSAYSPLGNLKEELLDNSWIPFKTDRSVLTKPIQNEWGTWIRVLVPVKELSNSEIIGILGLSYSAATWNRDVWTRMIPDAIIALSLLILFLSLLWVWGEHIALKERSTKLAFDEALYRNLFEQAPIGIVLTNYDDGAQQFVYQSFNPMAELILGDDIQGVNENKWTEITHPEDLPVELEQFERFVKGEIDGYSIEKRIVKPDGTTTWVNAKVAPFLERSASKLSYLCLLEDISARKAIEENLRESERSKGVLLSHLPGMAFRALYDRNWTMEFISDGCQALTGYTSEELLYNQVLSYNNVISPEYQGLVWEKWTRVLEQRGNFQDEYEIITKTGERKWVLELGQGVYDKDGNLEALEGIVLDISEQKKREAHIAYLSERDFLTGLYNRNYLEQAQGDLREVESLPLSMAICDINGLRMINDAYGHAQGDQLIIETAKLIQSCCRIDDVLGRISGGEFMLFMPRTTNSEAQRLAEKIQDTLEAFNRTRRESSYQVSLSIGYNTRETLEQDLVATIKTAENYLKSSKLLNQSSSHHSILASIMATLYAKSQETEEHGQRLGDYANLIGEHLGLGQKSLDDLRLLSMLHDIGKIGVDDQILNKPGKLTAEEWMQMKKHPEIGHRIVMSTPELKHIADLILHHHERWDGMGYPAGLKGQEIPLLSRILAVAGAYDAMLEDRVYRKAISTEAALDEIRHCAGTQFDPEIAGLLVEIMEQK